MKFGKHIQKRQLEIPEYTTSFVDYKALKKLIKKLSATPVIPAQNEAGPGSEAVDAQASLQANKATFFFRLERELEKVNRFYLQKEAELRLRLETLLEKKTSMQTRPLSAPKLSSKYIALEEGFKQFSSDLDKLQQFVEVNQTAFSKILKKWDKTSKSKTKELYLSRAVEVQPCFNRDVISALSDQATTNLLEFAAWAEGENISFPASADRGESRDASEYGEGDVDTQIFEAIVAGNVSAVEEWVKRSVTLPDAQERITKAFLNTADRAPEACLKLMLNTNMVNLFGEDEINNRNCLHKAAISGRDIVLRAGLSADVDVKAVDAYGRIPLHYACMHGQVGVAIELVKAAPETVNSKDQDNFTPLIHAIVHSQLECVELLLSHQAQIDPAGPADHIPLNLACQHESQPIVELLLRGHPRIVPDAEGLYPQHLVARCGRAPQLLLTLREYGVNLDQQDTLYRWTPLFHAASEGHLECLKILLECGVNARVLDEKRLPAVYYATWEGHVECMRLLAAATSRPEVVNAPPGLQSQVAAPAIPASNTPATMEMDIDDMEFIQLPPPIIPVRRYGHNFLDTKTLVVINFGPRCSEAIQFFDDKKYPAARLSIASKSSDLIPRSILLPIQDDEKVISFQIDNLDSFSIDFDIFPTFGAKVIARTVPSPTIFTGKASSSGACQLELFDPRLRVIGRLRFNFQVITPFRGIRLEITDFATYWKATSKLDSHPNALITGSSLSGEYVRLFVQMTTDGIPVLFPRWKVPVVEGLEVPINWLTNEQFVSLGSQHGFTPNVSAVLKDVPMDNIPEIHRRLASSCVILRDVLDYLSPEVHVELHVLYPTRLEEDRLRLGPTPNINDFADALLAVVFDHTRRLREGPEGFGRSIVFSSFHSDLCTALNWKQPNYPVLLCNELSTDVRSSSRATISIKEAVNIAQNNNFMGLICSSQLLDLAPALIQAVKTASLVLVTDISNSNEQTRQAYPSSFYGVPDGVDGFLKGNGVLKFHETIDM